MAILAKNQLATVTIIFPPSDPCRLLNLQEWINLIIKLFKNTNILIPDSSQFPYIIYYSVTGLFSHMHLISYIKKHYI